MYLEVASKIVRNQGKKSLILVAFENFSKNMADKLNIACEGSDIL